MRKLQGAWPQCPAGDANDFVVPNYKSPSLLFDDFRHLTGKYCKRKYYAAAV